MNIAVSSDIAKMMRYYKIPNQSITHFYDLFSRLSVYGIRANDLHQCYRNFSLDSHCPKTIVDNIEILAEAYSLTPKRIARAAIIRPTAFTHTHEQIKEISREPARILDLSQEQFIHLALRLPPLFHTDPFTLLDNVKRLSNVFDMSEKKFTHLCLKNPNLLYARENTVEAKMTAMAACLNVEMDFVTKLCAKQSSLAVLTTSSVLSKADYVRALVEAAGKDTSFEDFVIKYPVALARSKESIRAAHMIKTLGLSKNSIGSLIVMPKKKVAGLLTDHFAAHHNATGKGARTLNILYTLGIIDDLPPGIPQMKLPRRTR